MPSFFSPAPAPLPARSRLLAVCLAAWAWSCGPTIVLDDATEGEGTTSSTATTTGPTTRPPPGTTGVPTPPSSTTSTTSTPEETMGDPDDTGVLFLIEPDGGGIGDTCDVFAQNCPPSEKCVPWIYGDGDIWNYTRCAPVSEDPDAVGEPCLMVGSPYSGIDSCDFGAMCWNVDPETLQGTCVEICLGDEYRPMCSGDASCAIAYDGTVAVCLPGCNPLLQNCGDGQVCYGAEPGTACMPDDSADMGSPGEWCQYPNECQPGNTCVPRELVLPECPAGPGCCTAFCDLNDPMPPCLPGQTCQAWFDPGTAPMGLESLGFCGVPA